MMESIYPNSDIDTLEQLGVPHTHLVLSAEFVSFDRGYIVACRCGATGRLSMLDITANYGDPERARQYIKWEEI